MSEFGFKSIHQELPEQFLHKSFIWIWHADKVPPHIGISVEKEYFSLTYNKSEQLLTASMLKKAKRSLIPMVFVEIPKELVSEQIAAVFSKYERAVDGITCLRPIREVIGLNETINQLVDLLLYLESKDLIDSVNGLNLPAGYRGIPDYSMEDILKRISKLNEVK